MIEKVQSGRVATGKMIRIQRKLGYEPSGKEIREGETWSPPVKKISAEMT